MYYCKFVKDFASPISLTTCAGRVNVNMRRTKNSQISLLPIRRAWAFQRIYILLEKLDGCHAIDRFRHVRLPSAASERCTLAVLWRHVQRQKLAVAGHLGTPLHCDDRTIPRVVLQHLPCGSNTSPPFQSEEMAMTQFQWCLLAIDIVSTTTHQQIHSTEPITTEAGYTMVCKLCMLAFLPNFRPFLQTMFQHH